MHLIHPEQTLSNNRLPLQMVQMIILLCLLALANTGCVLNYANNATNRSLRAMDSARLRGTNVGYVDFYSKVQKDNAWVASKQIHGKEVEFRRRHELLFWNWEDPVTRIPSEPGEREFTVSFGRYIYTTGSYGGRNTVKIKVNVDPGKIIPVQVSFVEDGTRPQNQTSYELNPQGVPRNPNQDVIRTTTRTFQVMSYRAVLLAEEPTEVVPIDKTAYYQKSKVDFLRGL